MRRGTFSSVPVVLLVASVHLDARSSLLRALLDKAGVFLLHRDQLLVFVSQRLLDKRKKIVVRRCVLRRPFKSTCAHANKKQKIH